MSSELKIVNYQHARLLKDLKKKKANLRGKASILYGNIDRFSNGWPPADVEALISRLKQELEVDPLSSNGLINTDGWQRKLFPHLPRGGVYNTKGGYLKHLATPDIPVALVANVLRMDLGMQNNPINNTALKEAGLPHPDLDHATRHLRLAAGGLTFCTVLAKVSRKEMKRQEGQRPQFIRPEEVELIVLPNMILDALVGPLRPQGDRSTENIPPSIEAWRGQEIQDAVRKGKSGSGGRSETTPAQRMRKRSEDTRTKSKGGPAPEDSELLELHGYLRVVQLRDMCRDNGLSPGGNKLALIRRLVEAEILAESDV